MTTARKDIYDENAEGVYHCYSRCVRQAFLCGFDAYTGKNYDHRKQWVEELLERAAASFAIDILNFAVLDNHLHVTLRNRPDLRKKLTPTTVARRWLLLYPKRWDEEGRPCEPTEKEIRDLMKDKPRIEKLRKRLGNISWLMGYVKEKLARRANLEDDKRGTFFEKRFEMKRLLSENAILACSIYVDLNEVRAGIAATPESSTHTSAYLRIQSLRARHESDRSRGAQVDYWLAPIHDRELPKYQCFAESGVRASDDPILSMTLEQYLELLDFSGRQVRKGKRGKIPDHLAPILERLGIKPDFWHQLTTEFDKLFRRVVGDADSVEQHAADKEKHWFHGLRNCRRFFVTDVDE